MELVRDAVIERILSNLNYRDNKWRNLILDENSKEILLNLISNEEFFDINYMVDDRVNVKMDNISIISSKSSDVNGNIKLRDILSGIYPYQGHCFHLNSHAEITLPVIELCRLLKINPECYYINDNCKEIAGEIRLSSHQSKAWNKCSLLLLSRSNKLEYVYSKTYHQCVINDVYDELWKELRYLKIKEAVSVINEKIRILKKDETDMKFKLEKSTNITKHSGLAEVAYNVSKYQEKKQSIQKHLKNLDYCVNSTPVTLKDKHVENKIKLFITSRDDQKNFHMAGIKAIHPILKEKLSQPIFFIFILEGFTLREVYLTVKLMKKYQCKIILGGKNMLI